jgi:hypothetical protein
MMANFGKSLRRTSQCSARCNGACDSASEQLSAPYSWNTWTVANLRAVQPATGFAQSNRRAAPPTTRILASAWDGEHACDVERGSLLHPRKEEPADVDLGRSELRAGPRLGALDRRAEFCFVAQRGRDEQASAQLWPDEKQPPRLKKTIRSTSAGALVTAVNRGACWPAPADRRAGSGRGTPLSTAAVRTRSTTSPSRPCQ